MNACRDTRMALTVWSPGSGPDLPDRIALHLDRCPACRETFDEVYSPALVVHVSHEMVPVHRPWTAVMVAAASLLFFVGHAAVPLASPGEGELSVSLLDALEVCEMAPSLEVCEV